MSLTVEECIEALSKFPKDWPIQLGLPNSDEACGIKGIFDCSESEYGYLKYAFVQIEPMTDLDLDELYEANVEMYGDRNWYNTKDTFSSIFNDLSKVEYKLSEKGEVIITECKNKEGEDISLDDIDDTEDQKWWL